MISGNPNWYVGNHGIATHLPFPIWAEVGDVVQQAVFIAFFTDVCHWEINQVWMWTVGRDSDTADCHKKLRVRLWLWRDLDNNTSGGDKIWLTESVRDINVQADSTTGACDIMIFWLPWIIELATGIHVIDILKYRHQGWSTLKSWLTTQKSAIMYQKLCTSPV